MKKAIFKGFAVAALALAVLFTGCNNGQSNIEEVKVDAVEITAKAYPGYNYVTWGLAADANGSTVTILRDDGTDITPASGNFAVDTDIKDGVTYKYTAYVSNGKTVATPYTGAAYNLGDTEAKNGYVKVDAVSSDSCTAINPICIKDGKLMTALELCDFEDKGDSDFVINEENIIFEKEANGTAYYVAFPTKQYLSYNVKVYYANEADVFGIKSTDFTSSAAAVNKAFYTNDSAVRYTSGVTAPGEYTTVVQVKAINTAYQPSYITAKNKFTVEALDVASNTTIKAAGYKDAGKTVRLIWTPATKKADGKDWEVGKYTVYVQDKLTGVWTALAGTPKATTEDAEEAKAAEEAAAATPAISPASSGKQVGKTVYYFDYTVPSNEVAYDFAVVLADNGKVESALTGTAAGFNKKQAPAYAKLDDIELNNVATVAAAFTELDKDGKSNDARLTITLKSDSVNFNKKDFSVKSVSYKVIAKNDNATYTAASLLLDSEIIPTTATPSADYTKYDAVAKDVAVDSKVVFLYVLSYKDKADTTFVVTTSNNSGYSTPTLSISYPTATSVTAGAITATLKETATTGEQTWKFDYYNSDEDDYKLYDYSVFYGKLDAETDSGVVSWTPVTLTPAKNASKTAFEATAEATLKDTTGIFGKTTNINDGKVTYTDKYVLKFVKTLKSVSDSTGYAVVYSNEVTTNITK